MSQILGAFGLLDFTMLAPVLAWRAFWNLWTVYFFNFQIFSGRGNPRITEIANTESVYTGARLYLLLTRKKDSEFSMYINRAYMSHTCVFRSFRTFPQEGMKREKQKAMNWRVALDPFWNISVIALPGCIFFLWFSLVSKCKCRISVSNLATTASFQTFSIHYSRITLPMDTAHPELTTVSLYKT
jgi:hypothetical protein